MPDDTAQPLTPIPTLQPTGSTPGQIQALRDFVKALQQPRQHRNPYYTWANGLDDMTRDIMGGIYTKQANDMERASGRRSGQSALGLPTPTPYTSPTSNPWNPASWFNQGNAADNSGNGSGNNN